MPRLEQTVMAHLHGVQLGLHYAQLVYRGVLLLGRALELILGHAQRLVAGESNMIIKLKEYFDYLTRTTADATSAKTRQTFRDKSGNIKMTNLVNRISN